ncbi:MAG TPA: hypothetical protein VFX30_06610 [bacterium]|nr:hypothetical protein [bacterium]
MADNAGVFHFRAIPLAPLQATIDVLRTSRISLFGTCHENTEKELEAAFQRRFPSPDRIPRHIAIELDTERFKSLAKVHDLEGSEKRPVYFAKEPDSAETSKWGLFARALVRAELGLTSLGIRRKTGHDMAFGAKLGLSDEKTLYLVDRDFSALRDEFNREMQHRMSRLGQSEFMEWSSFVRQAQQVFEGLATLYRPLPISDPQISPRHTIRSGARCFYRAEDAETCNVLAAINDEWLQKTKSIGMESVYDLLMTKRNRFIARHLVQIMRNHPGQDVVFVTGALHTVGLLEILSRRSDMEVDVTYTDLSRIFKKEYP